MTAHYRAPSLVNAHWDIPHSNSVLPELPPLEECRGALGMWSGAEHCETSQVDGDFLLPAKLEKWEDTGLTRAVALGGPGASLSARDISHSWLRACAPNTEILCGQADHLLSYLDPKAAASLSAKGQLTQLSQWLNGSLLHEMAGFLLELGAGVVVIGLREQGVYLRTHADGNRVAFARRFAPDGSVAAYLAEWVDREMLVPLFEAERQNTFSATDAIAAGIAASLLAGQTPGDLLLSIAAVATLAGESRNPLDGMAPWEVVQARVEGGWIQSHCRIDLSGWGEDEPHEW